MNTQLPAAFQDEIRAQLGPEFPDFERALQEPAPVSLRINSWKNSRKDDSLPGPDPVPWHPDGRYLNERPVFTLDPVFHAGGYYVQEASSMILRYALDQVMPGKRPLRILDLCASPGGKSTLLASWMPGGSLLLANEAIQSRVGPLQDNLERWGYANTFTCSYDPAQFEKLEGFFDLVLVDAPCSGEGLFRKDPAAIDEWSADQVRLCVARQQRILGAARKLVSPGGYLVYSTCTYNDQENEGNARWLSHQGLSPVKLDMPSEWKIVEKGLGYQMFPHKVRGEGFYFSVFRRTEGYSAKFNVRNKFSSLAPAHKRQVTVMKEWLNNPDSYFHLLKPDGGIVSLSVSLEHDLILLDRLLPKGVWFKETGQFKGSDFLPGHALALGEMITGGLGSVTLEKGDALSFLKKETIVIPESPKGWLLMKYGDFHLGWVKNLGNRVNNYYPKDWRIRMDIREI